MHCCSTAEELEEEGFAAWFAFLQEEDYCITTQKQYQKKETVCVVVVAQYQSHVTESLIFSLRVFEPF